MKRNIKLQTVSAWSIALTSIVAVLCLAISCSATRKFHALLTATDQYILCEDAARQLQSGSDYLTEQVRLFTITGQEAYMDRYFEEAETNRSRERAVEALEGPFGDTCSFRDLQAALDRSRKLMDTEYYAMRLVLEATGVSPARWPEKVKEVELSGIDGHLPAAAKQEKAQQMVTDGAYQAARTEISNRVTACMTDLSSATKQQQGQALDSFRYLYPEQTEAYSWWSYRFKARERNAGWRIDYFLVSEGMEDRIEDSKILSDQFGSDHCPVELILK